MLLLPRLVPMVFTSPPGVLILLPLSILTLLLLLLLPLRRLLLLLLLTSVELPIIILLRNLQFLLMVIRSCLVANCLNYLPMVPLVVPAVFRAQLLLLVHPTFIHLSHRHSHSHSSNNNSNSNNHHHSRPRLLITAI